MTNRDWKTTVSGAIMLAFSAFVMWRTPDKATDAQTLGLIAGGAGLLMARDSEKPKE